MNIYTVEVVTDPDGLPSEALRELVEDLLGVPSSLWGLKRDPELVDADYRPGHQSEFFLCTFWCAGEISKGKMEAFDVVKQ